MGIKNAEILCRFGLLWKSRNKSSEKCYQRKSQEKWSFLLSLLCAKVFILGAFCIVFKGFKLGIEFCALQYDTHIECFQETKTKIEGLLTQTSIITII
jgi:hypothetical protein